VTLSFLQVSTE